MQYLKKMPKVWRKVFNKEELKLIQVAFKNVVPGFNIDPELGFHKMVRLFGNFPHPETNETDGSVGIEPKSVKKFLKTYSMDKLESYLLQCLIAFKAKGSVQDAEGFYDWDAEFKIQKEKAIEKVSETDSLAAWSKLKMAPKSYALLISNPDLFNPKILKKIISTAGVENLIDLSESEQFFAVSLMNRFGSLLLSVSPEKIMNHGFCPESMKITEGLDISINPALNMLSFTTLSKNAAVFSNITASAISLLSDIADANPNLISDYAEAYSGLTPDEREFLEKFSPRELKYLYRYNRSLRSEVIKGLKSVYENRCSKGLETMSGKNGSYTWELIPKDSIEGLFLGYATDCCQIFNGYGHSCLVDGYTKQEGGFFVVRKNNKIYAQSYVFEGIDKEGLKYLVFDSIEVVGKNLKTMSGISESYLAAAKLLTDNGYSYVFCGADGHNMPDGLEDISSGFISYSNVLQAGVRPLSSYTDIKNGVFILAGEPSFDQGEEFGDNEDDYDEDDYDEDDYDEDDYDDNNYDDNN